MKTIVIATNNNHKFNEIKALLEPLGFKCLSLNDLDFKADIKEDGETFFENAYKKAKTIADLYGFPTLGDDSGLIVEALPTELGVRSKRFSKAGRDDTNNELLLKKLENKDDRTAYFVSQIVLYFPSGKFYTYQGRVYGKIAKDYKGNHGFGYDPLFIIDELNIRMAELERADKNKISHRARALNKLIEDIKHEVISF